MAGERLQVYPTTPTSPYLSVREASQSVSNAIESNATLDELVVNVNEDEAGRAVRIGTPNVAQVESILDQMLGPNVPITVEYDAGSGSLLSGRFRNQGRMRAGDAIFIKKYTADYPSVHQGNEMCTAGFGAKDKAGESSGQAIWRFFVLTSGHCNGLNSVYERNVYRSTDSNPLNEKKLERSRGSEARRVSSFRTGGHGCGGDQGRRQWNRASRDIRMGGTPDTHQIGGEGQERKRGLLFRR